MVSAWVFIYIGAVILVVMVGALLYYDFRTKGAEDDPLRHRFGMPDKFGRWPRNPTMWK